MGRVTIIIDTDNAAFDDNNGGGQETARILHWLAGQMEYFGSLCNNYLLRDANGNTCGSVKVKE